MLFRALKPLLISKIKCACDVAVLHTTTIQKEYSDYTEIERKKRRVRKNGQRQYNATQLIQIKTTRLHEHGAIIRHWP